MTNTTTATFDLAQLDALSTTACQGSLHSWSEDSTCCYEPLDAAEAAALASQRALDFLAEESPFRTRDTLVSAARKKMARRINDFDTAFERAAGRA